MMRQKALTDFLSQVYPPHSGESLFDCLTDVVYFVKDRRGSYLVVNNTLVLRCRAKGKEALIGKTPADVLPAPLGERYTFQDQTILKTGTPLLNQLELHVHPTGDVGWCLTNKLPLKTARGEVIGLVGVSQDLRLPDVKTDEYQQLASAIEYAEQHAESSPSVEQIAALARMTRYQLDRRMRLVFGLSCGQWLMKSRIDRAQRLLEDSEESISSVALQAGYSDQSAFTRQFRRATGLTPGEFRRARLEVHLS